MDMENTTILINEKEKEEAKALTQSFARGDVKSRAYVNALGAEVGLTYLRENGLAEEFICNIHSIRKLLEEFDIADIRLSNINIDVRMVFDENQIFIPKSHFNYNITPDVYIVFKVAKDYSSVDFIGFFEPKMINKNNANDDYYFMEKEKLSSPVDLKSFIDNFRGSEDVEFSEEDTENAEVLMISMADNNISDSEKKQLISYLTKSSKLRDKFIEFENFEMLASQASGLVDFEATENINDMDISDLCATLETEEELEAITGMVEESSTQETTEENDDSIVDMIGDAAILGAEIAGTALASSALAAGAEAAETVSEIMDTVDTAASITETVANIANEVSNSIISDTFSNNDVEISEDIISENNISEELDLSTLDLNQEELNLTDSETLEQEGSSVFNESNEIEFSNNDDGYDDIVFENNDSYGDYDNYGSDTSVVNTSEGNAPSINHQAFSSTIHTPISEATELVSFGDIQSSTSATPLPKEENTMETMEMDEFQSLVDNYVPNEIKDESPVVDFNSLPVNDQQQSAEETAETQDEELLPSLDTMEQVPQETLMQEDFEQLEENLPDIDDLTLPEAETSEEQQPELTSDDFVEDISTIEKGETETTETEAKTEDNASHLLDNEEMNSAEELLDSIPALSEGLLLGEISEPTLNEEPAELEETEIGTETDTDNEFDEITDLKEDDFAEEDQTPATDEFEEDLEITESLEEANIEEDTSSEDIQAESSSDAELEDFSLFDELEDLTSTSSTEDSEELNALYSAQNTGNLDDISFENENYTSEEDFSNEQEYSYNSDLERPKTKKIMPALIGIFAALLIGAGVVGYMVKNKNSIDAETLIQSTPDNEELASPETDNSGILADLPEDSAVPEEVEANNAQPQETVAQTPSQEEINKQAKQEAVKDAKEAIKQQQTAVRKPLNSSKNVTLKKISWEVPNYLSYSENINSYLQTAGRSIRASLSGDLLLTSEYIYSNKVKVNLLLSKDGTLQDAKIVNSSGSDQVDKIVLQTVKDTLSVVKPAQGEVPTPNYKLALIIYL